MDVTQAIQQVELTLVITRGYSVADVGVLVYEAHFKDFYSQVVGRAVTASASVHNLVNAMQDYEVFLREAFPDMMKPFEAPKEK